MFACLACLHNALAEFASNLENHPACFACLTIWRITLAFASSVPTLVLLPNIWTGNCMFWIGNLKFEYLEDKFAYIKTTLEHPVQTLHAYILILEASIAWANVCRDLWVFALHVARCSNRML